MKLNKPNKNGITPKIQIKFLLQFFEDEDEMDWFLECMQEDGFLSRKGRQIRELSWKEYEKERKIEYKKYIYIYKNILYRITPLIKCIKKHKK